MDKSDKIISICSKNSIYNNFEEYGINGAFPLLLNFYHFLTIFSKFLGSYLKIFQFFCNKKLLRFKTTLLCLLVAYYKIITLMVYPL